MQAPPSYSQHISALKLKKKKKERKRMDWSVLGVLLSLAFVTNICWKKGWDCDRKIYPWV